MAISEWRAGLLTWWRRRRRFAEEWAFHRDAAIAEFEALGDSHWRARKGAKRRMGARRQHRRSALAAIGGDLPGLWCLLPIRSLARSAFLVPATLLLGMALAVLLNPARGMAVRCISAMLFGHRLHAAGRIIPLTPAGYVPVGLAGVLLRTVVVAGVSWAVANLLPRKRFLAFLYSVIVLCEIVLGAAVSWVTGIQILASRSWGHDRLQGFALLGFLFAFVALLYVGLWRWWADVENRCPYCLRLPGMPEIRGNAHDVLLDPLEIESICFRGHGVILQNRWRRRFETGAETAFRI
ncbi:MAG TPA: hypothetical protein VKB88_42340 [Bryobacteraceae bacterium]|nr:hypothetical protein [Bryobacteraceae bacterium]